MIMSISPIQRIASTPMTQRLDPVRGAAGGDVSGFGQMVSGALETVSTQQATADKLAEQAATGQLRDPHEYMIAATEASLSTELTVAIRNKAVEAFTDIMRMGI